MPASIPHMLRTAHARLAEALVEPLRLIREDGEHINFPPLIIATRRFVRQFAKLPGALGELERRASFVQAKCGPGTRYDELLGVLEPFCNAIRRVLIPEEGYREAVITRRPRLALVHNRRLVERARSDHRVPPALRRGDPPLLELCDAFIEESTIIEDEAEAIGTVACSLLRHFVGRIEPWILVHLESDLGRPNWPEIAIAIDGLMEWAELNATVPVSNEPIMLGPFSPKQLASKLGRSWDTVKRWIDHKVIRVQKRSMKAYLIHPEDLWRRD